MKHRAVRIVKTVLAACLVLVLAVGSSAQEQTGLAESYLAGLARKSRTGRQIAGGLGLVTGGLCAVVGASALEDKNSGEAWISFDKAIGQYALISGATMAAAGVLAFCFPSPAERAFKKALAVQDPVLREQFCAGSLADLSRKARRFRYIGAGLSVATGIVLALSSGGRSGTLFSCGALFGGVAVLQLCMKTPPEKAYAAYLKKSGFGPGGARLTLGVGPRRSAAIGFRLGF